MDKLDRIIINEKLLAIIVRADFKKEGAEFFTPPDYTQQLAYMNRPKGYVVKAHMHSAVPREVLITRETLFIKSGKVRVDFYCDNKEYAESRVLQSGDVLLIVSGGHGFEFVEAGEMIEVKQGPYFEERDAVKFKPVDKTKLKVRE